MGLRLVGLLPCAVWTPKLPKPRIAGQARTTTTPYPIVTATAGSNIIPVSPIAAASSLATRSDSSCRCVSSSTQPLTVQARPTPTVSAIAQPSTPIRQISPAIRPIASNTTNSPMLLVPFAMPGFVPVQGQQPATAIPSHTPHMQALSSMIPATAPPSSIQQGIAANGGGTLLLAASSSSFNKPNSKVCNFLLSLSV